MKLTKNEKKALKLLLDNGRISDSEIALKLNITSQAVGKIRKKLEEKIVDSYSVNIKHSELGVNMFAVAFAKLTRKGLSIGEVDMEKQLLENPHIINLFRIHKGTASYMILYAFQNISELDDFFHSTKMRQEFHDFIETENMFTFSHNSVVKNDAVQFFQKVLDESGTKNENTRFTDRVR